MTRDEWRQWWRTLSPDDALLALQTSPLIAGAWTGTMDDPRYPASTVQRYDISSGYRAYNDDGYENDAAVIERSYQDATVRHETNDDGSITTTCRKRPVFRWCVHPHTGECATLLEAQMAADAVLLRNGWAFASEPGTDGPEEPDVPR